MCAKIKMIRYKEIFWYDESAFYLPRQDMNKSENPDKCKALIRMVEKNK